MCCAMCTRKRRRPPELARSRVIGKGSCRKLPFPFCLFCRLGEAKALGPVRSVPFAIANGVMGMSRLSMKRLRAPFATANGTDSAETHARVLLTSAVISPELRVGHNQALLLPALDARILRTADKFRD
jgi:hypothetical protein